MESQKGGILSNTHNNINSNNNVEGGGMMMMMSKQSMSMQQSVEDLTKEYEKMLQKLEADIRGHIRVRNTYNYQYYYLYDLYHIFNNNINIQLEHEMKIHLDYLEGRVEELEN